MRKPGKRGPWTDEEKQFIRENYGRMSHKDIARTIGRDPSVVKKYIKKECSGQNIREETVKNAAYRINESPIWNDLKRQLSAEEQEMFMYHWTRIIAQFQEDVFPTEELQIIDMIKMEILMNRTLNAQQQNKVDIERAEAERETIYAQPQSSRDYVRLDQLDRTLGMLRSAQQSISREYREMLDKKNGILNDMKATRDKRIKEIESDKKTFTTLLQRLIMDKTLRQKIGLEMEKMRLATQAEWKRLSELHKYEDGMVDRPILDSESVSEENDG